MSSITKVTSLGSLDRLAFWSFLASGAFIVLFSSPDLLGLSYNSPVHLLFYLLPWVLLWPVYSFKVIKDETRRPAIMLIGAILILGILNVILSDDPHKSYGAMRIFLLTGVLALWTSMFLLTGARRRELFAWFCCGCLAVITSAAIITYLLKGSIFTALFIFGRNPIPLGTLVILLLPGPLHLWFSGSSRLKIAAGALLALSGLLIWLAQKRGAFLAVAPMVLVWVIYRRSRLVYPVVALLLAVGLMKSHKILSPYQALNPEIPSQHSVLYRLELYPFAWHIYKQHPLLGIGIRPYTHDKYLDDYQQYHLDINYFAPTVRSLQTFDNMLVTAFVELGTLMTLAYLGLISYILVGYWRRLRPWTESRGEDFALLLPLLGWAVHSLTYDSLLFPTVNWLFHAQLGLLAGFSQTEQ